jgi:uncharacterized protein
MGLTPSQINTILVNVHAVLGAGADVLLYGSRLDDQRKGGDVDLLIESEHKPSLLLRARIKLSIENALQLPTDVLLVQRGTASTPFEWIARKQAVALRAPEHALP